MERGACLRKKGCSCEQLAKENMKKKHTTLPVSLPNSHPPVRARVSPACSGSVSDLGKATLQPPALHQASLCSSLAHASDRGNFHVAFKFPFRDTAHGNAARVENGTGKSRPDRHRILYKPIVYRIDKKTGNRKKPGKIRQEQERKRLGAIPDRICGYRI